MHCKPDSTQHTVIYLFRGSSGIGLHIGYHIHAYEIGGKVNIEAALDKLSCRCSIMHAMTMHCVYDVFCSFHQDFGATLVAMSYSLLAS